EARLLAEIDSVLGPDRPPSESDLPLLPYTEAVVNEAMRLFPPAHATTREVGDAPVEVGGLTVPARTPVLLSIYSAHHDPHLWPR
ncbi:Cytochrome P450 78A4, partial [Tetrabaena socialis]